jgi:hypothetical protein
MTEKEQTPIPTYGKLLQNVTTEDIETAFHQQLDDEKTVITESFYNNLKSKKCYGNCPDIKIGQRLLYFIVGHVRFQGNSIKKNLKKGNVLSAYKKVGEHKTEMELCRVTEDYLNDPSCELFNFKYDKTVTGLIPRFIDLENTK